MIAHPTLSVVFVASISETPLPVAVAPRVFQGRTFDAVPDGRTESGNTARAAIQAALKQGRAARLLWKREPTA